MFVTNWISTTKIQKISEITNFFRHYFLSRTEVYHQQGNPHLPASACQHHGRDGTFFLHRTGERGSRQTLPNLREDKH